LINLQRFSIINSPCGEWRSPVARLLWEQEVAGSNPVSPTRKGDLRVSDTSTYISLYRRWRPQRFSDVVGQDEVVRTLRNAVITDEVAHAYLLAGERGIGKTSIARILARAVNCLSPEGGEPCNQCANCVTILANRSLDILEIDGASNRGIDHIRRLREEVNFSPTDLKKKVYIIDEVHMLTNEAFNALLKTLEEPPPHAVFIFATTEPHKVPRTIISRCQAFDFRKIPSEKIAAHLTQIAQKETMAISEEALRLLARKANGGMRDGIVMLEQAASFETSGEITLDVVLDMLGLVGHEIHDAFLQSIESGDRKAILDTIDTLVNHGKDLEIFLSDLIEILRNRLAEGSPQEDADIALCRGLLDIKQDLFRSLDQKILLEVGLLSLMNQLRTAQNTPQPAPSAITASQSETRTSAVTGPPQDEPKTPLLEGAAPDTEHPSTEGEATDVPPQETQPIEQKGTPETEDAKDFPTRWRRMIEEIERERIAIAAFLTEATPHFLGKKVAITFHPEHTFHKESLEKTANVQYLAGMIHRHFGDQFDAEINIDPNVKRNPSAQEELREKAKLVCQVFDGKIIKEA
jgi:DNA polymerase-3 subunit gamma/tau